MSKTFATNSLVPERRKYQVIQTTPRRDVTGIKLGDKKFKFNKNSRDFYTTDTALAREICDTQGQNGTNDVLVIPVEKNIEPGHIRTFTVPELPWHKGDNMDEDGHNYFFAGGSTEATAQEGSQKEIGGVVYVWINTNGKLQLTPLSELEGEQ